MTFKERMNAAVKRLSVTDIKLIKLSTVAFTLMLARLWPPIASLDWYWYALAGIVFAVKPAFIFFSQARASETPAENTEQP